MLDGQIEQDLSALLDSRTRPLPSPALRRLAATTNSEANAPGSANAPAMAAPAADASAVSPERDALLAAREATHGSFADNARVSQSIKDILRAEPGWGLLTSIEREAMDMIALKFSRILSGKSLELQHWEDVRGYAALAEEQCKPV